MKLPPRITTYLHRTQLLFRQSALYAQTCQVEILQPTHVDTAVYSLERELM